MVQTLKTGCRAEIKTAPLAQADFPLHDQGSGKAEARFQDSETQLIINYFSLISHIDTALFYLPLSYCNQWYICLETCKICNYCCV